MFNDQLYRSYKDQMNYVRQKQPTDQFTQTLIINEIIKCGLDILGTDSIIQEEDNQEVSLDAFQRRLNSLNNQTVKKYIYKHNYKSSQNQSNYERKDSQAQISFTLSNEDKQHKKQQYETKTTLQSNKLQNILKRAYGQKDIEKADILIQTGNFSYSPMTQTKNSSYMKSPYIESPYITKQTPAKRKLQFQDIIIQSPIKVNQKIIKKTFIQNRTVQGISNTKLKKRNPIFSEKIVSSHNPLSYSYISPFIANSQIYESKTPQKVSSQKKFKQYAFSEKIVKNVYGKLKDQVKQTAQFQQYMQNSKRHKQNAHQCWEHFIQRSEKWAEMKNNSILQKQIKINQLITIKQNKTSQQKYIQQINTIYGAVAAKPNIHKNFKVQSNKVPIEKTFKVKNPFENIQNQRQSIIQNRRQHSGQNRRQRSIQNRRQNSVQNCLNKLKVQTQLLKVKLLDPMKKDLFLQNQHSKNKKLAFPIQKSDTINKKTNSINNYQQNVQKRFTRSRAGSNNLKQIYGKCIGQNIKSTVN